MRAYVVAVGAALCAACAAEQQSIVKVPLPPKSPWITGEFKTVSSADIRQAVAVMRAHIKKEHRSALPVYKVYVIDHDNMSFEYWQHGTETHGYVKRVKGSWQMDPDNPEVEVRIVRGFNIPTG